MISNSDVHVFLEAECESEITWYECFSQFILIAVCILNLLLQILSNKPIHLPHLSLFFWYNWCLYTEKHSSICWSKIVCVFQILLSNLHCQTVIYNIISKERKKLFTLQLKCFQLFAQESLSFAFGALNLPKFSRTFGNARGLRHLIVPHLPLNPVHAPVHVWFNLYTFW